MKCSNCGHENDADAKFCEKCGSNLNKSSIPASTKILIVVVIVLVAGLGLVSGMMLMKNQAKPISNNTTGANNNTGTNNSTSSSSNSPQTSSNSGNSSNDENFQQNPPISESQALAIVEENAGPGNYVHIGNDVGIINNGQEDGIQWYKFENPNTNLFYSVNAQTGAYYTTIRTV